LVAGLVRASVSRPSTSAFTVAVSSASITPSRETLGIGRITLLSGPRADDTLPDDMQRWFPNNPDSLARGVAIQTVALAVLTLFGAEIVLAGCPAVHRHSRSHAIVTTQVCGVATPVLEAGTLLNLGVIAFAMLLLLAAGKPRFCGASRLVDSGPGRLDNGVPHAPRRIGISYHFGGLYGP